MPCQLVFNENFSGRDIGGPELRTMIAPPGKKLATGTATQQKEIGKSHNVIMWRAVSFLRQEIPLEKFAQLSI